MATTEEILTEAMAAETGTTVLLVNLDTRTITIPNTIKNLGVESDDDVTRVYFQMPRHYGECDLSEFNVRINYVNAQKEGDIYIPDDVVSDDDHISFSWLVGRHAAAYQGNVVFNVCLKKIDDTSVVVKEFNTTVSTLPILGGLETSEAISPEIYDIIDQLLRKAEEQFVALKDRITALEGGAKGMLYIYGSLEKRQGLAYELTTWTDWIEGEPSSYEEMFTTSINGKPVTLNTDFFTKSCTYVDLSLGGTEDVTGDEAGVYVYIYEGTLELVAYEGIPVLANGEDITSEWGEYVAEYQAPESVHLTLGEQ